MTPAPMPLYKPGTSLQPVPLYKPSTRAAAPQACGGDFGSVIDGVVRLLQSDVLAAKVSTALKSVDVSKIPNLPPEAKDAVQKAVDVFTLKACQADPQGGCGSICVEFKPGPKCCASV